LPLDSRYTIMFPFQLPPKTRPSSSNILIDLKAASG
jgi:hypothetical protein